MSTPTTIQMNSFIDKAKEKQDGTFTKEKWKCFCKNGNLKMVGNKYQGIYVCSGQFLIEIWSGSSYDFETNFKKCISKETK